LFFFAQANRGEITGLAIIAAKSLTKVLLFMAGPSSIDIGHPNFLFLASGNVAIVH
jgi:hypothetical protein